MSQALSNRIGRIKWFIFYRQKSFGKNYDKLLQYKIKFKILNRSENPILSFRTK